MVAGLLAILLDRLRAELELGAGKSGCLDFKLLVAIWLAAVIE
jgi:hypothetical protein